MNTLARISQTTIYYAFVALFFLTPLIFYPLTKYFPFPWFIFGVDPFTYELFEYNKMFFVYGIALIVGCAWIVRSIAEGKVIARRTFLDYPLTLFLMSQLLSTIFSLDIHTSIWGYYSRFHGGLMSTLCYLVLYWAFVSNLFERKYVHTMLVTSIISGTLVALYGIGQHFGVDAEYWVQNVQARVFSSLGQPNWLAAYLVALFPISLSYFLIEKKVGSRIFYFFSTCVLFVSFLYTASRSGLLAVVIGLLVFAVLVYIKRLPSKNNLSSVIIPLIITGIITVIYLYFYNKIPAQALNLSLAIIALALGLLVYSLPARSRVWTGVFSILIVLLAFSSFSPDAFRLGSSGAAANSSAELPQEAGGTETGRIRFIVWKGAMEIFKHYPVLGSGVESFAYAFYQYRPIELLQTTEWDFLYNKAHNEYFNFLATTGAFGVTAYLLFITAFLYIATRSYLSFPHISSHDTAPDLQIKLNSKKIATESAHLIHESGYVTFITIGLISAFITILITNFFGFSVVNVALLFFLLPAFIIVLREKERTSFFFNKFVNPITSRIGMRSLKHPILDWTGISLTVIAFLFLFSQIFSFWFADIAFAKGRSLNRQSEIVQAYGQFIDALSKRQDEPFYYSELGWTQGNIVYALMQQNDASQAAELVGQAEMHSITAVTISPQNITYWKKLADTYYNLTFFDKEAYNTKLARAADRTQTLAPTDVATLLTLSVYYERVGQLDTAYEIVQRSTEWKPDLGQAWYRLGELTYRRSQISGNEEDKKLADEYRYKASQLEPDNEEFKVAYE